MPRRLVVGQRTLDPLTEVRILAGQPADSTGGDVPEWFRERSAKPRTRVRFPSSPPHSEHGTARIAKSRSGSGFCFAASRSLGCRLTPTRTLRGTREAPGSHPPPSQGRGGGLIFDSPLGGCGVGPSSMRSEPHCGQWWRVAEWLPGTPHNVGTETPVDGPPHATPGLSTNRGRWRTVAHVAEVTKTAYTGSIPVVASTFSPRFSAIAGRLPLGGDTEQSIERGEGGWVIGQGGSKPLRQRCHFPGVTGVRCEGRLAEISPECPRPVPDREPLRHHQVQQAQVRARDKIAPDTLVPVDCPRCLPRHSQQVRRTSARTSARPPAALTAAAMGATSAA